MTSPSLPLLRLPLSNPCHLKGWLTWTVARALVTTLTIALTVSVADAGAEKSKTSKGGQKQQTAKASTATKPSSTARRVSKTSIRSGQDAAPPEPLKSNNRARGHFGDYASNSLSPRANSSIGTTEWEPTHLDSGAAGEREDQLETQALSGNEVPSRTGSTLGEQMERDSEIRADGLPSLERVSLTLSRDGAFVARPPDFNTLFAGKLASLSKNNEFVFFTLNPSLQADITKLVNRTPAQHVAAVVIEPSTGRVLAMASKSPSLRNAEFHTGFPAASLFKVITAAAAIETNAISPESLVRFRGGNYTLTRSNYLPSNKSDKRIMSVGEALGKSVNPVFGRLALQQVGPRNLRRYASSFGFNAPLLFDTILDESTAYIPEDEYELSRTGAGFGSVHLSPIHAAAIMAAIVNRGQMVRPYFIDKVVSPTGRVLYRGDRRDLKSIISPRTADTLLDMMKYTITVGTSRRDFMYKNTPVFPFAIAGKTGTLSGDNPKGLNSWFIASGPVERPRLALAVVTVNPTSHEAKASYLGRKIFESYLDLRR